MNKMAPIWNSHEVWSAGSKGIIFVTEPVFVVLPESEERCTNITLHGTNVSHLGTRKIIFKSAFKMGDVSSQEGLLVKGCSAN